MIERGCPQIQAIADGTQRSQFCSVDKGVIHTTKGFPEAAPASAMAPFQGAFSELREPPAEFATGLRSGKFRSIETALSGAAQPDSSKLASEFL